MHVITIRLPDPSALTYVERGALKDGSADDYRANSGTDGPVAVDIIPS